MFLNNDERINSKFLYRKPVVIGILDDSDNDPNDMSWMFDNSWELLKLKFSESSFQELVIGLVEIFRRENRTIHHLVKCLETIQMWRKMSRK